MKLLLDIGNSRVKWAWLEGVSLQQPGAAEHRGRSLAEVIELLPLSGTAPREVLAASVSAEALIGAISRVVHERWRLRLRLAATETAALGVRNGYARPEQLGVDRWLAILAAYHSYRAAVCVVDAGTATTIDVVQADGAHSGGLIVPGLNLMKRSLYGEVAQIAATDPPVNADSAAPAAELGNDTEACMRNGALWATACLAERCARELSQSATPAVLVVTGGDASTLLGALQHPAVHRPLLVLEGLALRFATR